MDKLEWFKCNELGSNFAVELYEGKKYLIWRPMLEDGSVEGNEEEAGEVEECPVAERPVLQALFPNDLDALERIAFY